MTGADLTRMRRCRERDRLAAGQVVDVLVVGGGATGAGVALDAASRGLSVALVERRDLAFGTSRWSSKLIHGGLRYLASGDLGLAWESARERDILLRHTAPHLVRPLPMVIPLTPDVGRRDGTLADAGHHLASLLRRAAHTPSAALPPPRRLTEAETRRLLPGLRSGDVRGGLLHWDGQAEDDARLVLAIARTAAAHGAAILTYCAALQLSADGALVHDELDGGTFPIRARAVVNAAGVWAGTLTAGVALRPSKGSHLVLPAAALGRPGAAMTVPVPGERGRFVFALPHADDLVYLGLTDDPVQGPAGDVVAPSPADERFLLDTVNRALATALRPADVLGRFAGLRPLLAGEAGRTADLSRRHAVLARDGGWTVVGGKLTTYRAMAEDVVNRLTDQPCRTRRLPLVGAPRSAVGVAAGQRNDGADQRGGSAVRRRLVRRYGAEAGAVAALAEHDPQLLEPVAPGVPVLGVEFAFAVAREGALTVADLLERRTRLSLVEDWARAARPAAEAALGLVRS